MRIRLLLLLFLFSGFTLFAQQCPNPYKQFQKNEKKLTVDFGLIAGVSPYSINYYDQYGDFAYTGSDVTYNIGAIVTINRLTVTFSKSFAKKEHDISGRDIIINDYMLLTLGYDFFIEDIYLSPYMGYSSKWVAGSHIGYKKGKMTYFVDINSQMSINLGVKMKLFGQ
ncbi:hypothetical protein [Flammeovirga agarivorans]|uniref:Outer membrane protein beta-barrel domain-containing protein n=1 Tax=Flammeovirga agarivorans TaxID=2726742 RepID=A0A7X8XXX3_9BACT|nr:hypothetical protein [Flammeovirga agarivorans]NLR93485.1 hypothetical protein [Flammeovirga agarivorans]